MSARFERTPPHHERLQRVRRGAHGVRRTCGSEAGTDFDRALPELLGEDADSMTDQDVEDVRRHGETMAGIVVEIYQEQCRICE
jgi:hypothetical protein